MEIEDLSDLDTQVLNAGPLQVLDEGLTAYNRSMYPERQSKALVLVMRDGGQTITAGLAGRTAYGWLRVDTLWVSSALRSSGNGKRLLQQAEEIAIERGCHGVHLDTHEFQAPEFYRAMGYEVFGSLPDYPKGETHFYFAKRLTGYQHD